MKGKRIFTFDQIFDFTVNFIVVIATILVLYPLYFVVIASVSDPAAVNSGQTLLLPHMPSLSGYKLIFEDARIWIGYKNTLIYTGFGTLLALFLTIFAGYALSRKDLVGGSIIMKLMVFTMYFNGGLIPTYLVIKNLKLTDTPYVLIILGSFSVFNLIITRTFFASKIPKEYMEAASIDGCGNGRFFFSIVLPLSKEVIAVIALFYAVSHWNSFFSALIYVSDQKLYPLQLILRDILIGSQSLQSNTDDPSIIMEMQKIAETIKYGVIIVSTLPVLIFYPFIQRFFVKGIMIGGIKG
jgi:putative aldouronate transport system permease protein